MSSALLTPQCCIVVAFRSSQKWDLLPVELKQSESIDSLKLKIKSWIPLNVHAGYVKLTSDRISLRQYDHLR